MQGIPVAVVFLALAALVPWLATYVETGRWPAGRADSIAEVITSIFTLFLAFVAYTLFRRQRLGLEDQNERLAAQARTDGLTGLFNHRAFLDILGAEVREAELGRRRLSLAFIDLDGFKELNDRYGHPEGDRVLREAARLLRSVFGQWGDMVFRYGGDEFAVIVPGRSAGQVAEALSALQGQFRNAAGGRCGFSFGVSEWRAGLSSAQLVASSDRAMYAAKAEAVGSAS